MPNIGQVGLCLIGAAGFSVALAWSGSAQAGHGCCGSWGQTRASYSHCQHRRSHWRCGSRGRVASYHTNGCCNSAYATHGGYATRGSNYGYYSGYRGGTYANGYTNSYYRGNGSYSSGYYRGDDVPVEIDRQTLSGPSDSPTGAAAKDVAGSPAMRGPDAL